MSPSATPGVRPGGALISGIALALLLNAGGMAMAETHTSDLVVYGGTSAAVIAAIQGARMDLSVILVSPDRHLGGLTSGGLGWTDVGRPEAIGGLSRDFYRRIKRVYDHPQAWQWQRSPEYHSRLRKPDEDVMWVFEPHVAEGVFDAWLAEHDIPVRRAERLDRGSGVIRQGTRIVAIRSLDGNEYRGRMFIDATYEGDLMAAAEVSYTTGREANSVYRERWNGVQKGIRHHGHFFSKPVSAYVVPGDPSSGCVPRVANADPGEDGSGDHRMQAYCFRMCLTDAPENRIPFPKPDDYDGRQYELLARVLATGWHEVFNKFDPLPNRKTDTNNHGPFSTDNIGMNYDYPDASYARREEIIREHRSYQQGLMWFLANDSRVPAAIRRQMNRWGLPNDEFVDNGHWPHQLYIREARRMLGAYVVTEHDCLGERQATDPIGLGSYTMDSHNVQRYVTPEGTAQNEGDLGVRVPRPYGVAYRAITPKREECSNLLVPVCVSSSHVAFGSVRMEPVFMVLGQSAATAAGLAVKANVAVQDVEYDTLRRRLIADGQVLDSRGTEGTAGTRVASLPGIVVDDDAAQRHGFDATSSAVKPFVGVGYRHDDNANKGEQRARFVPDLRAAGRYEVRLSYSAQQNRATQVPVTIHHADGEARVSVNQRRPPPIHGRFVSLGTFRFAAGTDGWVEVSNRGTDGHVIIDAIQFLPAENQ